MPPDIDNGGPIRPATLVSLLKAGFKVVPLTIDGKPAMAWSPVFDRPRYWSLENLIEASALFWGVATVFGKSHVMGPAGEDQYLCCLDVDSKPVHDLLTAPLSSIFSNGGMERAAYIISRLQGTHDEQSPRIPASDSKSLLELLKAHTFVTKTRREYGHHIYWFEPMQHQSIRASSCMPGHEFELKCDKSCGHCTLPPSRHRNDPGFRYHAVGAKDRIAFIPGLYDLLVQDGLANFLKNKSGIEDSAISTDTPAKAVLPGPEFKVLTANQIDTAAMTLMSVYKEGFRDEIIFGLSGMTFRYGILEASAEEIISELCDATGDSEKESRLQVLKRTYQAGLNDQQVAGTTRLMEAIYNVIGDRQQALDLVEKIRKVFVGGRKKGDRSVKQADDDTAKTSKTIANKLVDLVKVNCSTPFLDEYGKPHVWANVADRYRDVIPVESGHFEKYLGGLFFRSTGEVVGKDSLTNSARIIAANAIYAENPVTRELHLRTAWKNQREEVEIRYDLTDELRRCVRVTPEGWEIIQNTEEVLFRRFGQLPQVEASRDYLPDIFDRFLDLMHVKNVHHRLLLKVLTISFFVPHIPHPINLTHGEKGSVKTTICRCIKSLVDPTMPELLTVPTDKREFAQMLYHHYLAVFDNVKSIPYWFQEEVCKAITGAGNSKRELFSNDNDVVYSYRRCVIINGIIISLTDPDALDRSILLEYERLSDQDRRSEAEVIAEFEKMKPQLLGFIFDTLARAMKLKPSLATKRLPRMADFTLWGMAICRAMGYRDSEFLDAYNVNMGMQNVEAVEASLLGPVIIRLVDNFQKKQGRESEVANRPGAQALWEGKPDELLAMLNDVAATTEFDIDVKKTKGWPKKGNKLTKTLRPMLSNLREGFGIIISIEFDNTGEKTGTKKSRWIRIEKVSPPSPPDRGACHNQCEDGGDGPPEAGASTSTSGNAAPPADRGYEHDSLAGGPGGDGGDSFGELAGNVSPAALEAGSHAASDFPAGAGVTGGLAAFDLEWSADGAGNKTIFAAAFAMSRSGESMVLHASDFAGSESHLLDRIKNELDRHSTTVGWFTTGWDSDLQVLHERCVANGIPSPVDMKSRPFPAIKNQTHIDIYRIYEKEMVRSTIFKGKYRSLKLDEVSNAVLGRGKVRGIDGSNVSSRSTEEQKAYVMSDAQLALDLALVNDGQLLELMKAIAKMIGKDFENVCHTGLSSWWAHIFDSMGCTIPPIRSENVNKKYEGGLVLEPNTGIFHSIRVVDVASLYPTMATRYNISFDTVNCGCCKDSNEAKVPGVVIDKGYWICKKRTGAFPAKLKGFTQERLRQKKLGNEIMAKGLKILINGGYGVFGYPGFKYYDPRAAELITAYGRYTLRFMQELAENLGFEIIAGDTDSLFLSGGNEDRLRKFIGECQRRLGIEVEHEKTYAKFANIKKKHYIGIDGATGNPDIKGMEGKKSDRPRWVNDAFDQFVQDFKRGADPTIHLKQAVMDLECGRVDSDLLKIRVKLSKNPEDYEGNHPNKKIGLQLGRKSGELIWYYKTEDGVSLNPDEVSIKRYKQMLMSAVKDALEIMGYGTPEHIESEVFRIVKKPKRKKRNKKGNLKQTKDIKLMKPH